MRDLFLAPLLIAILVQTFRSPSAGVLGWTWLTLMTPQKLIWGFLSSLPLNLILALATLAMVLVTKDKNKLPKNAVMTLWGLFVVWCTVTTITALSSGRSWEYWNREMKVMVLGLLVPVLMTTPRRIHALIWMIALSLGFFGVKGGLFTMMTGGGSHVVGPPASMLIDNNNLALALCMSVPLMNYLRLQAQNRIVRIGLLLGMVATTFGILGTQSRGGFVGLGVMAVYLWWRSAHKFTLAVAVVAVIVPAYSLMPATWFERMGTLKDASSQGTFLTRWDAWKVNFNIAMARPLTGGGFASSEDANVYRIYSYGRSMYATTEDTKDGPAGTTGGHAAHSIYLEVLGDHGFVGFALYFSMLFATLLMLRRVRRATRKIAELKWISELANMMQVSYLAFFVSGAALAMAYYDLVFLFIGITLSLDQMVKAYKPGAAEAPVAKPTVTASGKWRAAAPAA